MTRRYVMTARRRAALRKAQLASARKRKGRKSSTRRRVVTGVVAVTAGAGIVGLAKYRKYDRQQEAAQKAYLTAVAHNAMFYAGMHGGDDDEYQYSVNVPQQPRRYRNRPKTQQTKRSIAQHKKTIFGKAASRAENIATKKTPYEIRISRRKFDVKQGGARFTKTKLSKSSVFGVNVGRNRIGVTVLNNRKRRKK